MAVALQLLVGHDASPGGWSRESFVLGGARLEFSGMPGGALRVHFLLQVLDLQFESGDLSVVPLLHRLDLEVLCRNHREVLGTVLSVRVHEVENDQSQEGDEAATGNHLCELIHSMPALSRNPRYVSSRVDSCGAGE